MKISRLLMIVSPLLFIGLFIFPLWNITLEAPQYPIPLGMDIHINEFRDTNPHDIKNINLMNHYVGMQYIPDVIPEFKSFPIAIIISIVLGLIVALTGNPKWYLAWFIFMILLSSVGLIDFYLWETDYGHNLDPKAIMQFKNPDGSPMGFQPPLFGSKDILNFRAHSYPRLGAYFFGTGIGLSLLAFILGKREQKKL